MINAYKGKGVFHTPAPFTEVRIPPHKSWLCFVMVTLSEVSETVEFMSRPISVLSGQAQKSGQRFGNFADFISKPNKRPMKGKLDINFLLNHRGCGRE